MSSLDTRPVAAEPSFNEGLALTVDRALRHLDLPPGLPEQIKACELGAAASLPGAARRRRVPHLPRLARHAQLAPAAGQGRHPLRHLRRPGRGGGAGGADDLQVRAGGDVPFGGSKGGVRFEPRSVTRSASWRRSRAASPASSSPAATSAPAATCRRPTWAPARREMGWIADVYRTLHPEEINAMACVNRQAGHQRRHSRPDRGDRTRCAVRGARAVPPPGGPGAGRPGW